MFDGRKQRVPVHRQSFSFSGPAQTRVTKTAALVMMQEEDEKWFNF